MYVHFLNYLRSPLPIGCPIPSELGLDCTVLVDKSFYSRFSVFALLGFGAR